VKMKSDKKAEESAQKESASKENNAKILEKARKEAAERSLKDLQEKEAKKAAAEKEKKRLVEVAQEKATKETAEKAQAEEKKVKFKIEQDRLAKEAEMAQKAVDRERATKEKDAKVAAAALAEKTAKEVATKEAEKAQKEKVKEEQEKYRQRMIADAKAKEQADKAKELSDKAAAKARETAVKAAEAKERERKLECNKKKAAQELKIKQAYPKQISVSYREGWSFFGEHYSPLAVYVKGSICQLQGRLRKTKECSGDCFVAKINDHQCRPDRLMRFASNHDGKQVAISINKDGKVYIGDYQPDWISLSGITWSRQGYSSKTSSTSDIKPLEGWTEDKKLVANKHDNLCVLSGELSGSSWLKPVGQNARYVALLPSNCRPFAQLMYSTQALPSGEALRVDLHPNGKVEVVGVLSRPLEAKVSLDGISFSTVEGTILKLNTGFEAFGKGYTAPQARLENGICSIQGLTKGNLEPRRITTLPEWCRPAKTLTFNAPHNEQVMRLDVTAQGEVWLKTRTQGTKREFLSLSSINFPVPYESAYGAIMKSECK